MPSDEDVLKQAGMIAGEQLVILKSSGKKVPTLIGIVDLLPFLKEGDSG
jgi:hypothetical protein